MTDDSYLGLYNPKWDFKDRRLKRLSCTQFIGCLILYLALPIYNWENNNSNQNAYVTIESYGSYL